MKFKQSQMSQLKKKNTLTLTATRRVLVTCFRAHVSIVCLFVNLGPEVRKSFLIYKKQKDKRDKWESCSLWLPWMWGVWTLVPTSTLASSPQSCSSFFYLHCLLRQVINTALHVLLHHISLLHHLFNWNLQFQKPFIPLQSWILLSARLEQGTKSLTNIKKKWNKKNSRFGKDTKRWSWKLHRASRGQSSKGQVQTNEGLLHIWSLELKV